jgi:hypothetical protein
MFMLVPGPAMTMFGVFWTSSPVLGAPLLPFVQVAVVAVPPPDPGVVPAMPAMPAMAVLDDSWAATG